MKIYLKSLLGFPVGNLMLAISYILIYFIDGIGAYSDEIVKLLEFKYMLGQVVFSGLYCTIIAFTGQFIFNLFNVNYKDISILNIWARLGKFVIVLLADFSICKIISMILNRRGTLNGYSGTIFAEMLLLIMTVFSIGYIFSQEMQNIRINNALKKKQNIIK